MLDTCRIYGQLSPLLQQRLAQLALLQQRAAVLARLPALTLAKGKPVRWATTPAPLLLKQVMVLAALDGAPRLSALLLHNWFQHKMELCYQVRKTLINNNYLVPPVGVMPRPSATVMRLDPRDVGPGDTGRFFCPNHHPLGEVEATPEEVTLMAELLGWCVRRPGLNELDDRDESITFLKLTYQSLGYFEDMLADALATLPATAPAAQAAARGELPAEVGAAFEQALNWTERYRLFLPLRDSMCAVLEPAPDPDSPVCRADLAAAVIRAESLTRIWLARAGARRWMLDALAEVGRVRHSQVPDFSSLAAVHAMASTLTTRVEAADDTTEEDRLALPALMEEIRPLLALLDWIHAPGQLDKLAADDPDMLNFEAAFPAGVLNALLLRKLEIAPAPKLVQ